MELRQKLCDALDYAKSAAAHSVAPADLICQAHADVVNVIAPVPSADDSHEEGNEIVASGSSFTSTHKPQEACEPRA